ncbi:RHS repeat-associated core domain-containing protein [Rahnella ecdela]|uniref:RHS domain-containing protein n=1 Tax=Rahnella ecdela TaxID=2816250 RepID=A0ABS6LMP1_9GAMM|nr:RHS domain-containing protein [Rahnella ecdela]
MLTENRDIQLHTIYHPGNFVPLLRAEHARAEDSHRTLAEKLEEDAGGVFPPDVHERFNVIEQEIRRNQVSEANHQWLASVSLKAENIALWVDPLPESADMTLHLFHCDHLGTPVGLINHKNGKVEWRADLEVWGNVQSCDNPHKLRQPIRIQGQHFDEESGLHYNRHRYYDPAQGRYITQDPIGLMGGWNGYSYTNNPIQQVDPLGLSQKEASKRGDIKSKVSVRPDGRPWGAGCGDASTDKLVPDGLFGATFLPACSAHDKCYEDLKKSKATCDIQLGKDIVLACDDKFGVLKGMPEAENLLYNCQAMSGIYQSAVEILGGDAYETAQKAAKLGGGQYQ